MNYELQYSKLIKRAKTRKLDCYKEVHHIIPRCLGGGDYKDNLVELTAREHFIAHILLLKIYPSEHGLIKAVGMMCISNNNQDRVSNRMYGWLKKKFSKEQSRSQTGKGNSQFGTIWVTNIDKRENLKISPENLNEFSQLGWTKGRILDFDNYFIKIAKRKEEILVREKLKEAKIEKERKEANKLFLSFSQGNYESIRDFDRKFLGETYGHKKIIRIFTKYVPIFKEKNTKKQKINSSLFQ